MMTPITLNISGTFDNPSGGGSASPWVRFDGTVNPPVIAASNNVSSVVREAVGQYQINFTTPMVDANYGVIGMANTTANVVPVVTVDQLSYPIPLTTTSAHIIVTNTANYSQDRSIITVLFVR